MTVGIFQNTLYTHDNLYILYGMNSERVDLIYLDPPFNSKRTYSAPIGSRAAGASFKDMWTWRDVDQYYLDALAVTYPALARCIFGIGEIHSPAMMSYLTYMAQRMIEMHRVLKPTGSLYLHCDPTASHYLKMVLDQIFGKSNFRNEIIWHYDIGSAPRHSFKKKHDVILHYSKTKDYTAHQIKILPLNAARYNKTDEDGRKYFVRGDSGKRCYYDEGIVADDVWTFVREPEFRSLNSMAAERTGYPTQKPLALLNRIIAASSKEGDVVFDPFCGCATTCVAAQQMGRNWIGIDIETQAANVLIDRLSDDAGLFQDFVHTTMVPKRTDIEIKLPTRTIKEQLFAEQNHNCKACGRTFEYRDLEIDHIIPKSKGGGDYYENYQLLCASCNRIKGDRPMEYLLLKLDTIDRLRTNKITFDR